MRYSCVSATEEHRLGDIVPLNPRTGEVERSAAGFPFEKWSHSDWGLEIALQCACGWLSKSQNGHLRPQFYINLAHDEWYGKHVPATLREAKADAYRLLVGKAKELPPVPGEGEDLNRWLQQIDEVAELGQRLVLLDKKISFIQKFGPRPTP